MRKLLSGLFASALALTFVVTSFSPAQSAPIVPMNAQKLQTASDVIQVDNHRRWNNGGNWNNGNRHYKKRYYNGRNYNNGRYYKNGRYYRYGNNYNGAGVAAGVLAGALITGAIINSQNQPRQVYRDYGGNSHVQWCYNRYRSYRASDNTFQPYNGPRQQCYSPY